MEKRWRRLPGSRTEPAGLERRVLARLPMVALVGTAAYLAVSLLARLHWWAAALHQARLLSPYERIAA